MDAVLLAACEAGIYGKNGGGDSVLHQNAQVAVPFDYFY